MNPKIHTGQTILRVGADPKEAELAVILLHGRGATAESMLPLADALSLEKTNFIIPQAGQNRWYPNSAFAPLKTNEPDLTMALELIGSLISIIRGEGRRTVRGWEFPLMDTHIPRIPNIESRVSNTDPTAPTPTRASFFSVFFLA